MALKASEIQVNSQKFKKNLCEEKWFQSSSGCLL